MDHEYLQNVMGSPYVEEGTLSRLKARAAQAQQAGSAMLGRGIQDPQVTKVKSLWDGMMKSLRPIVNDWRNQVSPMLQNQKLSGQADRIKRLLDDLATTLGPILGQLLQHPRRYDDPTNIGGSPSFPQRTTGKLTELVEEGWWDAAKRDVGLNKKIGSNDPGQILDGYKNKLLSIYQSFLKDVKKMTGLSKEQIYPTLVKVVPQVKKVAGIMAELQTAVDSSAQPPVIQKEPSATPPAAPPPIPPSTPPTTPAPPVIKPTQPPPIPASAKPKETPPATKPSETPPEAGASGASVSSGEGEPEKFTKEDMLLITKRVCEIIINAVKEDVSHTGKFFDGRSEDAEGDGAYAQALPMTGPSLVAEADAPVAGSGAEKEGEDVPERPGEFVYNFHSKKRKYPSGKFVMPIEPLNQKLKEPIQLSVGPRVVEAWWINQGPSNKIGYLVTGQGKSTEGVLMDFLDHNVSSRSGATTPGHKNQFSIAKVMQNANPYGENPMAGDKTPGSSVNKLINQVNKKQEDLIRALGAVTIRKSMEFKPKPKDAESYNIKSDGSIVPLKRDASGKSYEDVANKKTQDELKALLASGNEAERNKWRAILDHYDYFKKFPDMLEHAKRPEERDEFQKAVLQLEGSGVPKDNAIDLVRGAWDTIRTATKLTTTDIKAEQLVAVAKPEKFGPFNDGVQALTAMGWTTKDKPRDYALKIWAQMVMQKDDPTDIQTNEFVAAVTKGKAPAPGSTAAPPAVPAAAPSAAPATSPAAAATKPPEKAKEAPFNPKPEDIQGWDSKGEITVSAGGKTVLIPPSNVASLSSAWRDKLDQMGYFDQFPHITGKPDKGPEDEPGAPSAPAPQAKVSGEPSAPASAPAPQAKVSGEPSAPAPQAQVSGTPSQTTPKPVQPQPQAGQPQAGQPQAGQPQAATPTGEHGTLTYDQESGDLEWTPPGSGDIKRIDADLYRKLKAAEDAGQKLPKWVIDFSNSIKDYPEVFKTFKQAMGKKGAKPKKPKMNLDELNEGVVNPFQMENLLL